MNIEELKVWFDSPEGKLSTEKFRAKLKTKEENADKWKSKIKSYLATIDDATLPSVAERFFAWETRLEDYYYDKRHCMRGSRLFEYVADMWCEIGIPLNLDEDFGSGAWVYRGYTFKLYQGQGSFWRVLYNGENIFQTT